MPNVSDGKLRTSLNIFGLSQVQKVFRVGTIYIFIIPVCSLSRCPGPTITRYNRQVLSRLARCIHLEIKGMVGSGPHPCYRMTHGSMTDYIDVLFIPPIGESAVHICCHPFFLFLLPCPLGPGVEARGWWFSSPNSFVPPPWLKGGP